MFTYNDWGGANHYRGVEDNYKNDDPTPLCGTQRLVPRHLAFLHTWTDVTSLHARGLSSHVLKNPNAHFLYTFVLYNIVLLSYDDSAGASSSTKRGDLANPRISHNLCSHLNEFARADCGRPSLPPTQYLNIDDAVVFNTLLATDAVEKNQLNSGALHCIPSLRRTPPSGT